MKPQLVIALLALMMSGSLAQGEPAQFAYGSDAFTSLISESYAVVGDKSVPNFYTWFEARYAATPAAKLPGFPQLSLREALQQRKNELADLEGPPRSQLELETGAWLHKLIKTTITTFSLDRGFEFAYTVTKGERQCLLQSTLIAGMLQSAGVNAGIVMVWKNPAGQSSNLGHVVSVVRLSDGRDVLVDASEPTPLYPHPGLFTLVNGQYRFLEAQYNPDNTISNYRMLNGETVQPSMVQLLPWNYIRSQYFYYRGERVPGGFINGPKTTDGRAASAGFLEQAIQLAPENPLATYVLGLIYQRQGKAAEGAKLLTLAYQMYQRYGFVPDGPLSAYQAVAPSSR